MSHPVLSIHNITKTFGGFVALNDVSLALHPGEIHAILGENGAGKSTLLNILAGITQATRGDIKLNGIPVAFSSAVDAAKAGITPQQWANYQDFTGKLDEAVAQQKKMVTASQDRTKDGQRRWLEQRNKVKAFDTLAQKHEQIQRYQDGRQEQKISDELTSRKHLADRNEES